MKPEFAAQNHWLVSAAWLQAHLDHPQVVVIDCRFSLADPTAGQQAYAEHHIPGAHYLDLNQDLSSPVERHGGRHPLPSSEQLAAKLTALGVRSVEPDAGPDQAGPNQAGPTLVVAYDDSRFAFAARLWWLLRYYGHDQVVLLDGGYKAWQAAGYPVTAAVPTLEKAEGQFMPQIRSDWIVDRAALLQAMPIATPQVAPIPSPPVLPFTLIDAREADRYRGEREPIDPAAGHIPGAINAPWTDVTNQAGFAQPLAYQQQRWATLAEPAAEPASDAEPVSKPNSDSDLAIQAPIVYCGSGVTACVDLLSLAMVGRFARLYPGSWSDWCSYF